ncbi:MAG: DUF47 family protein [Thaumarchaeota archaeon]|nr:DUF47 family protein [Nitrososphaerota archaeon]
MAQWTAWIRSNDKEIVSLLNDLARKAEEASGLLVDIFENFGKLQENHQNIKKIEREADALTHQVFEELNKTFVTPFDREDISRIASKTDDIIDYIEGISGRIVNFKIMSAPPYMLELARQLQRSAKEINLMITSLKKLKVDKSIIDHCRAVSAIEHEADDTYRKAVGDLLETTDVINIIKMKDIYESIEAASDRCLDVADSIEDVVLKYA